MTTYGDMPIGFVFYGGDGFHRKKIIDVNDHTVIKVFGKGELQVIKSDTPIFIPKTEKPARGLKRWLLDRAQATTGDLT